MEQPFYHDDSFLSAYGHSDLKLLKQNMSVGFAEPYRTYKSQLRGAEPDFYPEGASLKLASPELERLIIQGGGGVLTSPAPGHFLPYGRPITEEQEGFADGFVKALDELHKMNQVPPPNVSLGPGAGADGPVYTTLGPCAPNTTGYPSATISYLPHPHYQQPFPPLKEEPQTVPDLQSSDGSPPASPVDMENQERMKAERKRLRNRLAATKCRKRKLERISRLEDKVKALKTDNAGLSGAAARLREQVAQLQQKVLRHVGSGCQLHVKSC
ncbi:junB proto-oncogene, AP-1 transcription factor subunit a [Denticeps clupeoides]|uniref:Transcription factor JunB n=1 Tax=Denticeps clupeoides TaxID=299321 RepID=A0AAY4BZ62_9TELE|nr:transcription factor jun-B-like [Denticeps clupeoides]